MKILDIPHLGQRVLFVPELIENLTQLIWNRLRTIVPIVRSSDQIRTNLTWLRNDAFPAAYTYVEFFLV